MARIPKISYSQQLPTGLKTQASGWRNGKRGSENVSSMSYVQGVHTIFHSLPNWRVLLSNSVRPEVSSHQCMETLVRLMVNSFSM